MTANFRQPAWFFYPLWVVFMATAIPIAALLMAPISVFLLSISNLGADAGLLPVYDNSTLKSVGFFLGFSFTLAIIQWLLLRNYLPSAWQWFLATGAGLLLVGILTGVSVPVLPDAAVSPWVGMALFLLLVGSAVGVAQWLVLRRIVPNAFWIVPIDVAGASPFLLVGRSITNTNWFALLVILLLPGAITGMGLWFLLRKTRPEMSPPVKSPSPAPIGRRASLIIRGGLGVVVLVPMFFLCIWVYAASQLALAKNEGIYASVEEAVSVRSSQGWGGAQVVRVEDIYASINRFDGAQPHVWFGGARIYLDRVPLGGRWKQYMTGSYYLRVKDGWVHVPEGALPEFIGWVMTLYDMEDVNEWIAESR
jgi:hypothetical protein